MMVRKVPETCTVVLQLNQDTGVASCWTLYSCMDGWLTPRPGLLYLRKRPVGHCIGCWLGRCGKFACARIRSSDHPARRVSLYRLSYTGPPNIPQDMNITHMESFKSCIRSPFTVIENVTNETSNLLANSTDIVQLLSKHSNFSKGKGKAIPLQAWTDPEGSRKLRLPDFNTINTCMWQGCQPYAPVAFTPGNISGTLLC
jgi:hypothetical protein